MLRAGERLKENWDWNGFQKSSAYTERTNLKRRKNSGRRMKLRLTKQ